MNHKLSPSEAERAFSAMLPQFRPSSNGRGRSVASHRGGDNPTALSVDISNGGRYYDHVTGNGGDVFDLAKLHLGGVGFREAVRFVSGVVGRDLLENRPATKRKRHTPEALAKAVRFRVGLIWRIEECLQAARQELWGDRHEEAAAVIQDLTRWLSTIAKWSDYKAADLMKALGRRVPHLVERCIEEAADLDRQLAHALAQRKETLTTAA